MQGVVNHFADALCPSLRHRERSPVRETGWVPCLDSNRRTREHRPASVSLPAPPLKKPPQDAKNPRLFTRGSGYSILLAPHPDPLVRNCSLVRLGDGRVPCLDSNSLYIDVGAGGSTWPLPPSTERLTTIRPAPELLTTENTPTMFSGSRLGCTPDGTRTFRKWLTQERTERTRAASGPFLSSYSASIGEQHNLRFGDPLSQGCELPRLGGLVHHQRVDISSYARHFVPQINIRSIQTCSYSSLSLYLEAA